MPACPDLGPQDRLVLHSPNPRALCSTLSADPGSPVPVQAQSVTEAEVAPGFVLLGPTLTTRVCNDSATTITCRPQATPAGSLIALGPARHSA